MDLKTFVPRKILICQLRQIGDVILMTPLPELLKKRFPDSEIHVLTEKKCVPVLEHNPHIDRIWPIDKDKLSSLWKEVVYYRLVAAQNFDLVVDLQQMPRCRWVVFFSKAPVGQISVQIVHSTGSHRRSPEYMGSGGSSSEVRMMPKRWRGPNSGVRTMLIQPNSPSPAATAAWRMLI